MEASLAASKWLRQRFEGTVIELGVMGTELSLRCCVFLQKNDSIHSLPPVRRAAATDRGLASYLSYEPGYSCKAPKDFSTSEGTNHK